MFNSNKLNFEDCKVTELKEITGGGGLHDVKEYQDGHGRIADGGTQDSVANWAELELLTQYT